MNSRYQMTLQMAGDLLNGSNMTSNVTDKSDVMHVVDTAVINDYPFHHCKNNMINDNVNAYP